MRLATVVSQPPWPGCGGHGAGDSFPRGCAPLFDQAAHRDVRPGGGLTFRRAVSPYSGKGMRPVD